jgi:hypothetical protein
MQSPGAIKTISNEQAMLLLGILNHQKVEQVIYTSMQSPGGIKTISNEQAMLLLGILNHQKVYEQSTYTSMQGPDSETHSISDRNVNTGALLIAQIHSYLLGLKSIKTLIVGLQKI